MDHELHPALTATGRFQVKHCLGAGGFGVVFDVHDAEANARVALKWLRNSDASTIARFKREFRSLADVVHPNLVGFRELLTVAGEWFFTMDLIEGIELLRWVRPASPDIPESRSRKDTSLANEALSTTVAQKGGQGIAGPAVPSLPRSGPRTDEQLLGGHRPLCSADLPRLRITLEQLGAGLDALHRAGMLHRDIKPSNVLVTREGRAVLLDLGLVTEMGQDGVALTKTGNIVGTPSYMSPEQAMGASLTPASDWYSVGVILYQALTGKLPLDGDPHALLIKKQLVDAPNASESVRGVPKALADLCAELLSRSPEARPSGAAFAERLRKAVPMDRSPVEAALDSDARPSGANISSAPPTGFVGRETHVWALDEALDEAERGKTVIALVHGPSGMGKTALVRHFLDGIRRDRPEVVLLEGRCYERESVPYKALDSLVDSLCRYLQRLSEVETAKLLPRDFEALARVFPVFLQLDAAGRKRPRGPVDAVQERRRAFDALRELIARLADRTPVVLFVDDLQWGDGDSEPLLVALLRLPEPPPLLLVAAYRSEDAATSPLVRALRKIATAGTPIEACEIPVSELSPEAATELASALLAGNGGGSEQQARALARESYGSPLFLRQLAALGPGEAKIDLAAVLRKRVAALPEDARRLLEMLAVSGTPLPLAAAARAAGIENDVRGVLSRLRAETLVRTRGIEARDEVEIYHDRIREVVVGELTIEELKARHRKLGRVLSSTGEADAEALAAHFYAADERDLAAEYAEKAADRAASALAFTRAAEMYELAIGMSSTLNRQPEGLVLKLAEALVAAGRGRDAADRFLEAAKKASPANALELRRRAAEQLLFSGHITDGLEVIEQILSAMNMRLPKTSLGAVCSLVWRRFLLFVRGIGFRERTADELPRDRLVRIDTCFSLGLGLGMVDPVKGADFQTRYLLLALSAGEPLRIARGLALESAYRAADGVKSAAVVDRLLAKASSLAERVRQPHAIALTMLMSGISRVLLGDYKKGVTLCDKSTAELREKCTGVAWELDNAAFFAGFSLISCGRIRDLAARLPALVDDARARGDLYGEIFLRLQCTWFVHLANDDVARAKTELASLPAAWTRDRFVLQNAWQMINRVEIALYEGDGEAAWQVIEHDWPRLEKSMFLRAETLRIRATNARARAALAVASATKDEGRRRDLCAIAARDARTLARERWPLAPGWALLIEAGLLATRGAAADATSRLREALAELESKDATLYTAAARLRLGERLGGAEGEALVARSVKELADERVLAPEKLARVFVPFSVA